MCTCTELSEKQGRAMGTETFAFLLRRIAFLSKCANNMWH